MTFEEQVLFELEGAANKTPHGYDPYYQRDLLVELAPRVAAAVEAAVAKERDSRQPNQYMLAQDYREAALWALRGGA